MLFNRAVLPSAMCMVLCCLVCLPALAWQDTSGPDASAASNAASIAQQRANERTLLRDEGDAVRRLAQEQEIQCYQRFAVEDCLRGVRRQQRQSEALLRQREMALNDQERQERADARRQSIAQKQSQAPESTDETPQIETAIEPSPRLQDPEAAQRALRQQQKQKAAQAQQLQRQSEQANRARAARERQANKLKAAQERRARARNDQVDPIAMPATTTVRVPQP